MNYTILSQVKDKNDRVIDNLVTVLETVRTGRANPSMLNHVEVDYYGSPTPLNQIASITVQEGRILVIKPYDSSSLKNIEKACNEANLGIAPQSDGTVVRLSIPALTQDTRKEMCKKVSKFAEEAKIQIRNNRRDGNDSAKKDETLTEDLEKDCLDKIQKTTDEYIKKIDEIASEKEKDVMTI